MLGIVFFYSYRRLKDIIVNSIVIMSIYLQEGLLKLIVDNDNCFEIQLKFSTRFGQILFQIY